MADFKLDIQRLFAGFDKRAEEVVRLTVLAVGKSIVLKSPVGNPSLWKNPPPPSYVGGHFRRNWQHGPGFEPQGEIPGTDAGGQATIAELKASVDGGEAFCTHYIVNNLPYGRKLEYDGHSSQAPAGMVGITAVEFETYVDQAVAQAKANK